MAATVKASVEGLERVDKGRRKKGWAKSEKAWADLACTSVATLKRFWRFEPIQAEAFQGICTAIGIVDWKSVTNFEDVGKQQSQTSVRRLLIEVECSLEDIDPIKLKEFLLQLQDIGGDATIKILDVEEGSVRLTLEGSAKALQKIEALFRSGELRQVAGLEVQNVHLLGTIPESFYKADLSGVFWKNANLSRADLCKANLIEACLRRANLSKAYFNRANLSNADLRNANLSEANLSGVNLSNADLSGANLNGANLSEAYLSRANLSNADLSNADLSNAYLTRGLFFRTKLSAANLRGAYLSRTKLTDTDFTGADLRRASFYRTNFIRANFTGANLSEVDLSDVNLFAANFSRANLNDANLNDANLRNANLLDVELSNARVVKCIMTGSVGLPLDAVENLKKRGAIFNDSSRDRESVFSPNPLVPR